MIVFTHGATPAPRPTGSTMTFTHGPQQAPATAPCVCGWNTPDHNGDTVDHRHCPAVMAATKALLDSDIAMTRMSRWSAHYIDPEDVALLVLEAVQAAQAEALAVMAAAFEPDALISNEGIPARHLVSVPTSSSPLTLDPHEAYYRPPFTGRAAA